jgi:hypothetical protein
MGYQAPSQDELEELHRMVAMLENLQRFCSKDHGGDPTYFANACLVLAVKTMAEAYGIADRKVRGDIHAETLKTVVDEIAKRTADRSKTIPQG